MKSWILFACLSLAGLRAAAQQPILTYAHFTVDGQELIWQHVVDTTLRAEDARAFYTHLSRITEVTLEENTILGSLDMLTFETRRYGGMGFGHGALIGFKPVLMGKLKVDLKDDRYRITLYDLRLVEGETLRDRTYWPAEEFFLMRDRRSIKPNVAAPDVLGVYDRFFQDYFQVHASAKNSDF
jgi:hypothetical protein